MTPDAKAKAAATKRMTALAGVRLPLPGQGRFREAEIRSRVAADLKPEGFAEMTWVNNIASCETTIELLKAQIAAVERRQMQSAFEQIWAEEEERSLRPARHPELEGLSSPVAEESQFTPEEWDILDSIGAANFEPDGREPWLDDPLFCHVLAIATTFFPEPLQRLRLALREEVKERDRILGCSSACAGWRGAKRAQMPRSAAAKKRLGSSSRSMPPTCRPPAAICRLVAAPPRSARTTWAISG